MEPRTSATAISLRSPVRLALAVLVCAQLCSSAKMIRVPDNIRVPSSYFVHFEPKCPQAAIEDLTGELTELHDDPERPQFVARVSAVLTKTSCGFAAKLSGDALQHVLANEAVFSVEEDQYMSAGVFHNGIYRHPDPALINEAGLWGINGLNGADSSTTFVAPCNLTGRGVDAYILDSGIMSSHTHFGDQIEYPNCDPADLVFNENQNGEDCLGHGTGVASIVGSVRGLGVAREATLLPVRVFNCTGGSSLSILLAGLECIVRHSENRRRPAVVNISIFGRKATSMKNAIGSLLRRNITVVTISGNARRDIPNDSCKLSPSAVQGVITVSGHDNDNMAYNGTNMGLCVDILAPGYFVSYATIECSVCTGETGGSSVAAPFVTGAVALLLQKCPHISPWEVKYHLLTSMAKLNTLTFPSNIPRRFRNTTPNLRLKVDEALCNISCNV